MLNAPRSHIRLRLLERQSNLGFDRQSRDRSHLSSHRQQSIKTMSTMVIVSWAKSSGEVDPIFPKENCEAQSQVTNSLCKPLTLTHPQSTKPSPSTLTGMANGIFVKHVCSTVLVEHLNPKGIPFHYPFQLAFYSDVPPSFNRNGQLDDKLRVAFPFFTSMGVKTRISRALPPRHSIDHFRFFCLV
ncbi:hypothetical protein NPIL_112491 [Nephila pilipes]|uniref:Uncharacterized protein n=1 Tax=Nephila pilipes TaxID=299642 RepID=A0A8X6MX26_NEPPI|nr:hypothetical protein NPIL_112491 [Nephila pilipes]